MGGDKPVSARATAVVLLVLALASCGRPATDAAPASTAETPSSSGAPFSTDDVSAPDAGAYAHLADVRVGGHGDFDRVVFEFADVVPGYRIGYQPLPLHHDPSAREIPLPGATAGLLVVFSPATAAGWTDDPRSYFGPDTVTGGAAVVTEAKAAGDFERMLNWVVGMRARAPFRVSTLDSPARVVIDIRR